MRAPLELLKVTAVGPEERVRPNEAAPTRATLLAPSPEVFCIGAEGRCGTSILFGSLATAEDRARPRCALYPFAVRGAA